MTEIAFYHSIPDPKTYLCRLLRKAYTSGTQVVVFGVADTLKDLSARLWQLGVLEFIPHACWNSSAAEKTYSPIYFTPDLSVVAHHQVVLNTATQVPKGFESFSRLLEVVGLETEDRAHARARLAFYKQRGYSIAYHTWQG